MRSFVLQQARAANYTGMFQEVTQLIGQEAAVKLAAQYGGTRLYIPATIKPEHDLCQLLGQVAAQQLAEEFCGLTLEIPRDVDSQIRQRNKLIMTDRAAGMTQRQLALKYRLTERTIRKITNSPLPPLPLEKQS